MRIVLRPLPSIYYFALALTFLAPGAFASTVAGHIKTDNFGYRTTDSKIAYFTENPGSAVSLVNASSGTAVYGVPAADIISKGTDPTSITGDTVWWVDFSAYTTPGSYYVLFHQLERAVLHVPDQRLYLPGAYDRHPEGPLLPALRMRPSRPIRGSQLVRQRRLPLAGRGLRARLRMHLSPNIYGTLNLEGGWHDAGDFNKYIGSTPTGAAPNWGGDSGRGPPRPADGL